jgi:hypothetical protein
MGILDVPFPTALVPSPNVKTANSKFTILVRRKSHDYTAVPRPLKFQLKVYKYCRLKVV